MALRAVSERERHCAFAAVGGATALLRRGRTEMVQCSALVVQRIGAHERAQLAQDLQLERANWRTALSEQRA